MSIDKEDARARANEWLNKIWRDSQDQPMDPQFVSGILMTLRHLGVFNDLELAGWRYNLLTVCPGHENDGVGRQWCNYCGYDFPRDDDEEEEENET